MSEQSRDKGARWNANNYPGTLQLCSECGEPTGRCEEESLYVDDFGPLCLDCWLIIKRYR